VNVRGETTCFLAREITDEPLAQNHQRLITLEPRGGGSQLVEIEHIGNRCDVQRIRGDIVPPSYVREQLELRRDDIAQICLHVVKRTTLREVESPKRVSAGQLQNL